MDLETDTVSHCQVGKSRCRICVVCGLRIQDLPSELSVEFRDKEACSCWDEMNEMCGFLVKHLAYAETGLHLLVTWDCSC